MSLREKFAWVALLTLIAGVCAYIVTVALGYHRVLNHAEVLSIAMGLIIALSVLPPAIRGILTMRMPRGAMTEQDERERLFELKATRIAFFVLAIGVLVSTPFVVHWPDRIGVVNFLLVAIVLAYLVKFGAEIRYHRRGY
jgi:fatty-acid desaturase